MPAYGFCNQTLPRPVGHTWSGRRVTGRGDVTCDQSRHEEEREDSRLRYADASWARPAN